LEVRNANNEVVWVESAVDESEDPGFFGALLQNLGLAQRQTTVQIPETTSWDGTYRASDQGPDGEPVPDGEYTYVLTVTDSRDVTGASDPRRVVVDNTPPEAEAEVDYRVFSPNGDGNQDEITLRHRNTSTEDLWEGRFTGNGTVIFDTRWADEPTERFVWDGRSPAGTVVDDGEYTYTLTATDRAGNTGGIDPITVTVDTEPRPLAIRARAGNDDFSDEGAAFSPNGDGVKDTVTFSFSSPSEGSPSLNRLESAVITVTDEDGDTVGNVEIDEQIAGTVTFTGYLDQAGSRRAPEATYQVSVEATYGNGTVSNAGPIPVTLDVTAPSGRVTVTDSIISPGDGDDYDNETRIIHDVSDDANWTGSVSDSTGVVLETIQFGSDVPSAVVWDGTDLDGNPVPDGSYRYRLIGTDPAGNETVTTPVTVTINRAPTLVDLMVSREYFSPNGDGEGDTVIITPQLSIRGGIAEYRFRLMDGDGNTIFSGSGEGPLPLSIPWDGRGADGEILPEGEYVGVLNLVYEKGNRPQALTPVVTIDNTIPDVALRVTPRRLTPNRDGEDEEVTFIPFVDPVNEIVRFRGQIQALDGSVVAELAGTRPTGRVTWDGTNNRGNVVPDGNYIATLEVEHRNGTTRRAQTASIALGTVDDSTAPRVAVQLTPETFSPDGDGRADTVNVLLAVNDESPIAEWTMTVRDPQGRVFYQYTGEGEPVRSFEWDGRNDAGERVAMATDYEVVAEVTDAQGNTGTGRATLTVDILTVERFGMRKIDLPDIIFEGYTTRYLNWNKDLSEQNVRVLNQIAAALEKFPEYEVELHGHAVSVLYYDEELSDLEHEQTLLPLSEGRSETIEDALVSRGLDRERFSLEWWGKLRPLVPFSDLDERFINRRVEFYLVR
ncbi:MAG: hypothetical protein ACOC0O_04160, partial [Spirochaetota bacterium]